MPNHPELGHSIPFYSRCLSSNIGGFLFGVIAAVVTVKSTSNTEQVSPVATTNTNAKVITAKMQVEQIQSSDMPMESMSDIEVRLSQQQGMSGMNAHQIDMINRGELSIEQLPNKFCFIE